MICIRCQKDSKYPERQAAGGRCPGCDKPFAFEPRTGDKMTDKAFQRAIDLVSAEGQVKWGVEHLYFELSRRNKSTTGKALALFFLFILVVSSGVIFPPSLLVSIPTAVVVISFVVRSIGPSLLPRGQFEKMWDRWGQVHGKPKGVIIRKPQETRPARTPESDIGDYSFDRAVICDRARTVDLLLANNFHFENNCAVLSSGGYPQQAFETVRRMLRRNPRLEVFVLHDITPEGCRLAHRLANDPEWFKGTAARIVDVGLRPAHAGPFKALLQPSERGAVGPGGGISAEEARWLSRHTLEIAVIRPEQIVKRLFRAMNRVMATEASTAPLPGRDPQARLRAGATGGTAAVAGAAAITPAMAMAEQEELARQQKKAAATNDTSGHDEGWGFELDFDSFSSDADASDGGADSFG
ncbi:hypothetical protein [Hyalangium rubrum]|uniref:Uncharacterized protein n=1 Tax=Hyalangium rubrum TaxID=3103134 RepID=A0ABU5HD01_9BACT|nr:hypothetical protein [Hyalangium sp. s54d21]MDY7231007.1 hypothetical protein [Hyalangium sp. s54d21]